jgi:hypothetical protein
MVMPTIVPGYKTLCHLTRARSQPVCAHATGRMSCPARLRYDAVADEIGAKPEAKSGPRVSLSRQSWLECKAR